MGLRGVTAGETAVQRHERPERVPPPGPRKGTEMNEMSVAQPDVLPPTAAYRMVSIVRIADHLYQVAQRDNRRSITDLAPADRRPYEQAATTALDMLDTLLAHAAEQEGAAS